MRPVYSLWMERGLRPARKCAHCLFSHSSKIIIAGRHCLFQADRTRTQAEYRLDAQIVKDIQATADTTGNGNAGDAA
jgi:hypothetical protein